MHWKPVPKFDQYEAHPAGLIRRKYSVHPLRPWVERKSSNKKGEYHAVELWVKGKRTRRFVHRIILETFVGSRPSNAQCRHLNGNSLDNRLENLTWGTGTANLADRVDHRPDYYLTAADIAHIEANPAKTCRELAEELGCGKSSVANLRTRKYSGYQRLLKT